MTKTKISPELVKLVNKALELENDAVDFYTQILVKLDEEGNNLPYDLLHIKYDVQHIIIDEQSHIAELKLLLGQ